MRTSLLRTIILLPVLLAGCKPQITEGPQGAPEDQTTHLGDKIDVSLADWLTRPRAELAGMADQAASDVQKQQEAARNGSEAVDLLPHLHAPVRVPVFEKAGYSSSAGLSLPPYLKDGAHDAAVALHLARHGDREAALKLADPEDKDLLAQIDAWRAQKNYPLEWTRLVALTLQAAQFKLAHGNIEGATEIVALHKQLRQLLDERSAKGPLGAALLPLGRRALQLAAEAWKQPKVNKLALAADVEKALADWGDVPAPAPGLGQHARRPDMARLYGRPAEGRAIAATSPNDVQRALDLLAVPVTPEGARAVVAFIGPRDRLDDVLVVYQPKINELFPEPVHLGHFLAEHGFSGRAGESTGAVLEQIYEGGGLAYDVTMLTRGNVAGATIRVGPAKAEKETPAVFGRNPRDFGAINLDRTFEANRAAFDPTAVGDVLKSERKDVLAKVHQPVGEAPPAAIEVQRELGQDLVHGFALRWPAALNAEALYRFGVPLWSAYGRSRFEAHGEERSGYYQLTWENDATRVKLRLPFDEQSPELIVEDAQPQTAQAARAEAARKFDLQERQARLAAGKPNRRLPRSLEINNPAWNGLEVEGLHLGMTRDEALACMPGSQGLRRSALKDGFDLHFLAQPPAQATYWAREMFVRFGPDNRLTEVRVRYQVKPPEPGSKVPTLAEHLRSIAGAPEEIAPTWTGLWSDLGPAKDNVMVRWRDDVTLLTFQRDAGGAEVILRDCPPECPFGADLPPLQFCSRGVPECALGDSREDVLKSHKTSNPTRLSNGAEMFAEPARSPYDVLLVWYDGKGKVSRIIARHRTPAAVPADGVTAALQEAWSRNFDQLGYVRRTDGQRGQVHGAYGWHDDVTRVRIFAQDMEGGTRLCTEVRGWPVAEQPATARK